MINFWLFNLIFIFINYSQQVCTQINKQVLINNDEVKVKLPGQNFDKKFGLYSGYFNISATKKFHYVLTVSKRNPTSDPVIVWFNGGPGASSLLGMFNEIGPYLISNDGKNLIENAHSWNNHATVLFIETPAGAGFSYATDKNYTNNDDQITEEHYKAIKEFYKKYPNFLNNSFYVAGSSYAGVYCSMLTSKIIQEQKNYKINLKGLLIGNGMLSQDLNLKSALIYAYAHGVVEERIWLDFNKKCCNGSLENFDIEQWDDNYGNKSTSGGYDQSPNACISDEARVNYMNNPDLLKALHIPTNLNLTWATGSQIVSKNYNVTQYDMTPFIKNVIKAKIPILLYYGDADTVLNFLGGQMFAEQLGLKIKTPKTPWVYAGQTAGIKTEYEGLTFITVIRAGHSVPQGAPGRSEYFLNQFLNNKPI